MVDRDISMKVEDFEPSLFEFTDETAGHTKTLKCYCISLLSVELNSHWRYYQQAMKSDQHFNE